MLPLQNLVWKRKYVFYDNETDIFVYVCVFTVVVCVVMHSSCVFYLISSQWNTSVASDCCALNL